MKKSVLIILADGFEEIEALTPIDLLRRAGIDVTVAGLNSTEITGAHSITVKTDVELSKVQDQPFDAVVLPGGMPGTNNLNASDIVHKIVRNSYRENKLVSAICAAPLVLSDSGILKDKSFTCYPGFENKITNGNFNDSNIIKDNNIITGKGVGKAIDFSLSIISELINEEKAKEIKEQIVY